MRGGLLRDVEGIVLPLLSRLTVGAGQESHTRGWCETLHRHDAEEAVRVVDARPAGG